MALEKRLALKVGGDNYHFKPLTTPTGSVRHLLPMTQDLITERSQRCAQHLATLTTCSASSASVSFACSASDEISMIYLLELSRRGSALCARARTYVQCSHVIRTSGIYAELLSLALV